nr:paired amphipathic helix protein Sin3-like 2 isoform X3 [Tanacetum cinerariifolium]
MLLESVNSALKRVEELLNGINNRLVSSEGSIRVEDHFSGLVAERKETKEKTQKDDDVLYSVAAGSRHSIMPHLEYDLTDKDIHEDLFKIIKYLCEEVCSTKEQVNQVLKLWTTFLEPMLYVPSRPENSDNVEDAEISTHGATRNKACNGDDNVSPKRVDSSMVIMVNGGTLPKEDGSRLEKDVKNTCIRDKVPDVGVVNDNVLPRSSTELSGRDATPRPRNVHDDGHEAKLNIDDVSSSRQGDTSRTPPMAIGNFAKFEKEEGELSPNVYFDEADLATCKNVPKGGDDVSGGESTADECSREDHEDGDRDDLNGKAENRGETEGIEDTNFIGADGTYSAHIFLSVKPLAKRVASPLHDGGKKDCNVKAWLESEKDIRLGAVKLLRLKS